MIVQKISSTTNRSFYWLYLDNGEKYKVEESVLIKYQIFKKGAQISQKLFKEMMDENEYYLALNAAFSYLSATHSKKEIKDHLLKKYPYEIVLRVIDKLIELKLINDFAYANMLVLEAKKHLKGKVYLRNELIRQEVDSLIIEEALEKYIDTEEIEAIDKSYDKNLANIKNCSKAQLLNRQKAYLTQRGFTNNNIIIVLEKKKQLLDNIVNEDKALSYWAEKYLKSLSPKYKDKDLEERLIKKLLSKGFSYSQIKEYMR